MPRALEPVEFNSFIAGYITEASPLTFPPNASLDEENFVLKRDGSRTRRLGFDLEPNYQVVDSFQQLPSNRDAIVGSFRWTNVGGNAEKTFIVVQTEACLSFFDMGIRPLSTGLFYQHSYDASEPIIKFGFASVDGMLVVVTGRKDVDVFTFDGSTISMSSKRLLVRDLFGVQDINPRTGVDLRDGNNLSLRPTVLSDSHLYNLRNQSWAVPKPDFNGDDTPKDLIVLFNSIGDNLYPSNADVTTPYIYANTTTESGSKSINRFDDTNAYGDPKGNSPAPSGYFIIDALDRGTSRVSAYAQMMNIYRQNTLNISSLPVDSSTSGATCVSEFAGRVFYSGFPGSVVGGDSCSPKLSSYVLFSTLVTNSSSIYACYQSGDPTSDTNNDLVDTDGGFIRLEGAYNISAMYPIQDGLVILAENGAWVIRGSSNGGFTATNYQALKITTAGIVASDSAVVVDSALMYWSQDGIYNMSTNEYGDFVADNVSRKTVQTFYNNIDTNDLPKASGCYDHYEQKVKWLIGNRYMSVGPTIEVILDISLGAYSKYTINRLSNQFDNRLPWVVKGTQTDPYVIQNTLSPVIVTSGDFVFDSLGNQVAIQNEIDSSTTNVREVQYLVIVSSSPTIRFTFGNYYNADHVDWESVDGVGVDARSFLLTGALSGGDYQRKKSIIFLTAHFNKTEDGLVDDGTGTGDLMLRNQSSCKLQAQWDWTNSVNSNRWSQKQEVYRVRIPYYPSDTDTFENGFSVVETKTKLRGTGKAVSLLFESSPKKHLDILGWSMNLGTNGNV